MRQYQHKPVCSTQAGAVSDPVSADASALPRLTPLNANYESQAAFSAYANWLLPGRLMAGRYPYVEPSRCATYEQGEAQVEAIVLAGATVFVSLQEELPPQKDMTIGGANGYLPYKAVVELMAAAHTPPPPGAVVNGVRNPKLDQFLPKRRREAAPEVLQYFQKESVSFVHWPLPAHPTLQQLSEVVSDLQQRLAKGEAVYLHGAGGRGRVGVVGACVLVAMYGMSADEAIERVQRASDTRRDGGDGMSPETEEQRQLVRQFAAQAGSK